MKYKKTVIRTQLHATISKMPREKLLAIGEYVQGTLISTSRVAGRQISLFPDLSVRLIEDGNLDIEITEIRRAPWLRALFLPLLSARGISPTGFISSNMRKMKRMISTAIVIAVAGTE